MNKVMDLTGMKFGKLTVVERDYETTDKNNCIFWKCRCDCGNIKSIRAGGLRSGNTTSCGCTRRNDLTGKRFGRWTVIKKSRKDGHIQMYLCKCDCGNIAEVAQSNLTRGKSKSCGCLQKEQARDRFTTHGKRRTRLYTIYANMKLRCYNKKNKSYKLYGERGITICNEWLGEHGFENFYEWSVKHGYADNLSIDRIDVNGNYEPSNCRWVNTEVQSNNQRKTIRINIGGIEKSLKQWTNFMEWGYGKYSARYRRGAEIFNAEEIKKIEERLSRQL